MNKFSIFMASLAVAATSFAQGEADPNRLILTNTIGNTKGYVLDRVQDITFARVDGEVKANVEIFDVQLDQLTLAVTKTEACSSYKLNVLPATMANRYDDLAVISYLNSYTDTPTYYDDFTNATLTGIEFQPATDYVLVTVGIDMYGVEDGVVRVPFTTPRPDIVGSPEIKAEVVDRQLESFSIRFTPNEDVAEYYCVAGEKGELMSQYEFFGPMMGLTSFTDMIIKWGTPRYSEAVVEWTSMAPNTDYEVYYVALDKEGTPADYQSIEVSTLALGGSGEASVAIELGAYEYADWWGEILPSQYITFTPNDQSSCYRLGVYLAEKYDPLAEEIKEELKSDPPMPMANWFQYDALTTDFQIDPDTECVAIAAAKNGDGEWGEVTELRFTTPSEPAGNPGVDVPRKSAKPNVKGRLTPQKASGSFRHEPGKAPVFPKTNKFQLK